MTTLQAVRPEGGIVPPSLFQHLAAPPTDGDATWRASLAPESYHLPSQTTLRDAASRSWTYLVGAWQSWRAAQEREPGGFDATPAALVRERWLLVLLQELGYGRLSPHAGGVLVGEQAYPVSHLWRDVPIHLLGPGVELDKRNPGVAGAVRAPQAMVQELLNRSDDHLWAILSNGRRLRLLRDSTALAGSAYIEFDLEAIFEGELFADFLLLWQVCHESRFEPRTSGSGDPTLAESWLEVWRAESVRSGARALDQLRGGVEKALEHLGTGFVSHPANTELRTALAAGSLKADDVHRHLLRLVYRLLFLFVTEDRDLLLDRGAPEVASRRYRDYLSTAKLRRHARERAGSTTYGDLWQGQRLVLLALGDDGEASLGLPALGGLFDTDDGTEPLLAAELTNHAFLEAIRDLAWIRRSGERLQPVDYRNLGAEELGSVYEALLELVPRVDVAGGTLTYQRLSGNERKTTGSYYTPPALVSALLDTALDPVIDEAVAGVTTAAEAEQRLLDLKVCDPACGSGHFLVAAARRIAQRLAAVRSGENQPTPGDVRHALRDVIGQCVYGVDLNPLAAELAKVSLWLEAMEPGKALGFLDARVRVGNSLLGTTPTLLAGGVPDGAFKPLEGDEKDVAREAAKRNKAERGAGGGLWRGQDQLDLTIDRAGWSHLAQARGGLLQQQDDAESVRAQARRWREYEASADYRDQKVQADAWVAAFVWPYTRVIQVDGAFRSTPQAPTSAVVRRLGTEPDAVAVAATRAHVERLAAEYRFFHWHIEFPEVFTRGGGAPGAQGWTGGFDAVLGNPPWERVKLQEQEFFAARDPEIASAPNAAARRRLIGALATSESEAERALHAEFLAARRRAEGESAVLRTSERFPLAGRGDVNTYAVFAELFRDLLAPRGRSGTIVPTGIATDATTQYFFRDLVESRSLVALFDFENRAPLFEGVDSRFKFCLLTLAGRRSDVDAATFAFFLHDPLDIEGTSFTMTPEEITLVNPNTGTLPIFRTRRDAEITLGIYRRVPVLIKEGDPDGNPWGVSFMTMFHMSNDSHLFHTREELERDGWTLTGNVFERATEQMLPLYQGRFIKHFDHRAELDLNAHEDPSLLAIPQYWVERAQVAAKTSGRLSATMPVYAFRNIGRSTDERSHIGAVIPLAAVGNSAPLIFSDSAARILALTGVLSSFAFDFAVRQKLGSATMNFFIVEQAPAPRPITHLRFSSHAFEKWVAARVAELADNAWDMGTVRALTRAPGPLKWSNERRPLLRAELDAAMFHLYGIPRDDVDYIMETFPIVKRKDIAAHGEYRTKRLILEIYDAMQHAIDSGTEYQTILDPPPGEGPRHPPKE